MLTLIKKIVKLYSIWLNINIRSLCVGTSSFVMIVFLLDPLHSIPYKKMHNKYFKLFKKIFKHFFIFIFQVKRHEFFVTNWFLILVHWCYKIFKKKLNIFFFKYKIKHWFIGTIATNLRLELILYQPNLGLTWGIIFAYWVNLGLLVSLFW